MTTEPENEVPRYVSAPIPIETIRANVRDISYASVPTEVGLEGTREDLVEVIDAQCDWFIDQFNYVRELTRAGRLDMATVPFGSILHNADIIGSLIARMLGRPAMESMVDIQTGQQTERGGACIDAVNNMMNATAERTNAVVLALLPKLTERLAAARAGESNGAVLPEFSEDDTRKLLAEIFGTDDALGKDDTAIEDDTTGDTLGDELGGAA